MYTGAGPSPSVIALSNVGSSSDGENYNATQVLSWSQCGAVGGMAVSSDGRTLFVACSSVPMLGSVVAISTNLSLIAPDGVPQSSISVLLQKSSCGNAMSLALSDDDSKLVVACAQLGVVQLELAPTSGGCGVGVNSTRTLISIDQCGFSRSLLSFNQLLDTNQNGEILVGCTQGTLLLQEQGASARWLLLSNEPAYVCAPVAVQLSRTTQSAWIACGFMGGRQRAGAVLSIDFSVTAAGNVSVQSVLPVTSCSQISSLARTTADVLLVSCVYNALYAVSGTSISPIGTDPRGYIGVAVDGAGRVLAATQCNSQDTPGSVVALHAWTNTPLGVPRSGQLQQGLAAGVAGVVLIADKYLGPRAALGPLSFNIAPGPQLCPSVARHGIISNANGMYVTVCSNGTVGQVYLLDARNATDLLSPMFPLPLASLCSNPQAVWLSDDSPPLLLVGCGSAHDQAHPRPSLLSVRGAAVTVLASSSDVPNPSGFAVSRDGSQLWMVTDIGVMTMQLMGGPASLFSNFYCARLVVSLRGMLHGLCNAGLVRWSASGELTVLLSGINQCSGSIGSIGIDPRSDAVYATCNAQWLYIIVQDEISTLQMPNECIRTNDVTVNEMGDVLLNCNQNSVYVLSLAQRCPVGYESSPGGCTACFLASHRNYSQVSSSSFQCSVCDTGSVAASLGSIDCAVCGPGKYVASQLTGCAPCAIGRYSSGAHNLECEPCDAGFFGNSTGLTMPTCSGPCKAGHWCTEASTSDQQLLCGAISVYCPHGSSSPVVVEPGMYTVNHTVSAYAEQTRSAALACEPGRSCDGSGLQRNCSEGFFASGQGNKECMPCEAGTFSGPRSEHCTPCPPGTDSARASSSCTPCLQGWQKGPGEHHCQQCAPGRFSFAPGAIACDPCRPGFFGSSAGLAECTLCARGTASNVTGRTTPCDGCLPGTYASSFGQSQCVACEADMYIGVSGSAACEVCNVPFIVSDDHTSCDKSGCLRNQIYSPAERKCVTCPLGQHSEPGGRCVPCDVGSYTPVAGVSCISCRQAGMEGLICAAGLASVKEGYWPWKQRVPAAQFDIYQTVLCPAGFCPGTPLQGAEAGGNGTMPLPSNTTTFVPQYCKFPRLSSPDNPLCGACAPDFLAWGQECVTCQGPNWGLLFLLVIFSFGVVLLLLHTGGDTTGKGLLTVLVYFSQTAAVIAGSVRGWIGWLGFSNLAPYSVGKCLAPLDPYQQFLLSINVPTIMLAEMLVLALIHRCIAACYHTTARMPVAFAHSPSTLSLRAIGHSFRWSRYAGGSISVLLFSYTQVTATAFSWLRCEQIGNQSVLFVQPAVDCQSEHYKGYRGLAIAVLAAFGVGFPLLALILIRIYRARSEKTTPVAAAPSSVLLSERSLTSLLLLDVSDVGSPMLRPKSVGQFGPADVSADLDAPVALANSASSVAVQPPTAPILSLDHLSFDSAIFVPAAASSSPSMLSECVDPLLFVFTSGGWFWHPLLLLRRAAFVLVSVLLAQWPDLRLMLLQLLCILSILLQLQVRPFASGTVNRMAFFTDVLLLLISVLLGGWTDATATSMPVGVQVALCIIIAPVSITLLLAVMVLKWRTWRARTRK